MIQQHLLFWTRTFKTKKISVKKAATHFSLAKNEPSNDVSLNGSNNPSSTEQVAHIEFNVLEGQRFIKI